MRISKEETAANRAKVLAAAARLFREKGVDGIAVAELMQAAVSSLLMRMAAPHGSPSGPGRLTMMMYIIIVR